ncbi:MAG: DUF4390 domain-containing protein, partial [Caldimonas sp.]
MLRVLGVAAWRGAALATGLATFGLPALALEPVLTTFEISRDEDGVYLSYSVDFDLARSVEDALVKSVPLFFVAEAEIYRDRWYWRDRRVAHATRVWKIVYQPLTST